MNNKIKLKKMASIRSGSGGSQFSGTFGVKLGETKKTINEKLKNLAADKDERVFSCPPTQAHVRVELSAMRI